MLRGRAHSSTHCGAYFQENLAVPGRGWGSFEAEAKVVRSEATTIIAGQKYLAKMVSLPRVLMDTARSTLPPSRTTHSTYRVHCSSSARGTSASFVDPASDDQGTHLVYVGVESKKTKTTVRPAF